MSHHSTGSNARSLIDELKEGNDAFENELRRFSEESASLHMSALESAHAAEKAMVAAVDWLEETNKLTE